MISEYNRSDSTVPTPQYNIRKRLQVFGREGAKVVVSEMKENLIGPDVISPLKSKQVTKHIQPIALN